VLIFQYGTDLYPGYPLILYSNGFPSIGVNISLSLSGVIAKCGTQPRDE
jgi:hypothetical protein